jgi:hypothetical protein
MRTALALALPVLLAAQSALLEVRLVGEGAVYAPGSRTAGLTVEIRDELNRPVAGAAVSLRLPFDGAGGAFANGLNTEVVTSGADGRATTSPVRWSRAGGQLQVRITAVKGQLRAGTLAALEISGAEGVQAARAASGPRVERRGSRRKWIIAGLILAGAAGAGFASGRVASGQRGTPVQPPPQTVQIGPPAITVGQP